MAAAAQPAAAAAAAAAHMGVYIKQEGSAGQQSPAACGSGRAPDAQAAPTLPPALPPILSPRGHLCHLRMLARLLADGSNAAGHSAAAALLGGVARWAGGELATAATAPLSCAQRQLAGRLPPPAARWCDAGLLRDLAEVAPGTYRAAAAAAEPAGAPGLAPMGGGLPMTGLSPAAAGEGAAALPDSNSCFMQSCSDKMLIVILQKVRQV